MGPRLGKGAPFSVQNQVERARDNVPFLFPAAKLHATSLFLIGFEAKTGWQGRQGFKFQPQAVAGVTCYYGVLKLRPLQASSHDPKQKK